MLKWFKNNMIKSPIRYFGGKGNGLANIIISHFPDKYSDMNYLEPFGGSAAVLFNKEISPIEIYNDLEENVYSLFKVISDKKMFNEFKFKCDITPYSKKLLDEYTISLKGELDILERAYRFFIINRTAYNGVGGFSASIVIRRNMSKSVSDYLSSIDRLLESHQRMSKVIIHNVNAIDLIKKYDDPNWLFYLDPPYHHSTRTSARYKVDMENKQQQQFLETVINCKNAKIIISGYDCVEYDILVESGWKKVSFSVKTQNSNRKGKVKTETLWKNY